jgi:heptosyltransferase-2
MSFQRIAVIGLNWLGDAVMSEPCLRALKDAHPDATITVVTKKSFAPLYECIPSVSGTITWADEHERKNIHAPLKEGNFDLAVILPRSFRSALGPWKARIPTRLGYTADFRSWFLNRRVNRSKDVLAIHRVGYYLRLLFELGIDAPITAPTLTVPDSDHNWVHDQVAPDASRVVAFNPGATYGLAKQWFPERYAEVARYTIDSHDAQVVIVGGPAEAKLGTRVASMIDRPDRVLDLSGRTTIPQLAGVLQRADLLVTNDTGPMHVAAAVDTPIVAIFGSTDPTTTPPYGDRNSIVQHKVDCSPCLLRECPLEGHPCMTGVETPTVIESVDPWIRSA